MKGFKVLESKHFYHFREYRLDPEARLLWRRDERIPLTPRVFDTLSVLVKNAGSLITKEELLDTVWPDAHVEEGNLAQNISIIRRTLGGEGFIDTIPKRGYRFVAPVEKVSARPPAEIADTSSPLPLSDSPAVVPDPASPINSARRTLAKRAPVRLLAVACSVCLILLFTWWAIQRGPRKPAASATRAGTNVEAYLAYLDGRRQWSQRTLAGVKQAIQSFERSIREDSSYAPAYSGLADSLILLGSYGVYPPRDIFPRARTAVLDALKLDNSLAEAHASLAAIRGGYDWDWTGAETEFRKAIQLKPDYPTAHQWYAEQLSAQGRHPEAIREAAVAVGLDPHSPTAISLLGLIYYFARRNNEALVQYRTALQFNPSHLLTWFFLGYVYEQQGKLEQAISAFQKGVELANGAGIAHLGHAQAVSGHHEQARDIVEGLKARSAEQYVSPLDVAMVYIGLRDQESAFTWMQRAYEDHSQLLEHLKVDPRYDPVRSDVRFHSLLKKIHLE
jgi:DNA-binding winged helix-turn-helix (wHTH) protein/tetratricopeptide (TPR) repeat protein